MSPMYSCIHLEKAKFEMRMRKKMAFQYKYYI